MVGCQVLAIDLRGHGDTVTTNEEDLSAETMARYLVVQTLCFSVKLRIILLLQCSLHIQQILLVHRWYYTACRSICV
jgi:hypothetical protein